MKTLHPLVVLGLLLMSSTGIAQTNPAFAPVTDDPKLARVLLIGDSISIGYTPPVQMLLKGTANVHRVPDNCQSTSYALEHIKEWLGDGKWDVIHFNWGIWDGHHFRDGGVRTTPEQYGKNLDTLVSILKSTKARLIWATTTPLATRWHGDLQVREDDVPTYGAVAAKVMRGNGIAVDDLYGAVLPHINEFRSEDGCHYTQAGSEFLAGNVARSIMGALRPAPRANSAIRLSSQGVQAIVDSKSGRILELRNMLTKESYPVASDTCRVETDAGVISLAEMPLDLSARTKSSCQFTGRALGLEIMQEYSIAKDRAYLDRTISVKNLTGAPIVLKSVTDCSLNFDSPFASAAFHNDNMDTMDPGSETYTETDKPSLYRTSVNVFLRNPNGGLCVGLKYPYWKPEVASDHVSLAYEMNHELKPGEMLDLPTAFFGVYKKMGYTCKKELHWKPRIIITDQEEMDWGEVRAMQKIMRDYLPDQPHKWKGYMMWLNAWWAKEELRGKIGDKEADAYCQLADNVKQSKCLDMMLVAPVWCGWTGFIEPCPEIDSIGDNAIFPRNPAIDRVMAYAKSIGLPMYGFCEPNSLNRHYRKDRPDWKLQPTEDPGRTLIQNCHANDQYEDWFYRLICSTVDTCGLSGWAWDHAWVRRPDICYSKDHGHEPGNCEFQQYRNVTGLIQKLRQRYPKLFMQIYWGLKEAGPWSLRGLNSLENAYENGSPPPPNMSFADDLRFQHWYNHNYRFIPTYLDMAQINFKKEANGVRYSLLSCMSASTHASLADWTPVSTQAEADVVFAEVRKWKAWASENMAYLKDRIDLFGQPCAKDGIDGTAHIIHGRGFIFVFNPWPDAHQGSIPLTDMIGLDKGSRFALDEISTGEVKRLGVYNRGDNFAFSIGPKSAMLIELKPTKDGLSRVEPPAGAAVQPAFKP